MPCEGGGGGWGDTAVRRAWGCHVRVVVVATGTPPSAMAGGALQSPPRTARVTGSTTFHGHGGGGIHPIAIGLVLYIFVWLSAGW